MQNNFIYSDSNKKDVNFAILVTSILLGIAALISYINHNDRLIYTFLGLEIILIYLFKRAEYVFKISESSIQKKWRFRKKSQIIGLSQIVELHFIINRSFFALNELRFTTLYGNQQKNFMMMFSNKLIHQKVFVRFLIKREKPKAWIHQIDKTGKRILTEEEITQFLG